MTKPEKRYAPLFAEFYGLIGERIDSIKERWKYQYPELKGLITNIQEALSLYQGSEKLDIFLPENIQGRDKTLKEDLIKDLQYISKGYKHIYEQAQTKNKEEQQEFEQERDNYFTKELLEDIERQQESMEKLFKLFQDNKQEYNKQLQVLIDEDFEKQKPIEILAKILSTLPEDSEEYKKQLHNFVDIAFKLQETERKLYQFPMDIKEYEKQLENFEGTEPQLQETRLKLAQLSEEHKKLSQDFIKLKHEQINVVQQETSGKRQLQREYEYGMKFLFNSQLQNDAIQLQHNTQNFSGDKSNFFIKQRDDLAKDYIAWLENIEQQTTRIVSATPKKNKSYVENRKLVRKEIIWANEIGLVDPEMLAIFEEYNDRPQEQNMKKLFNIARARYPYPENIEIINSIGSAKVTHLVQDGITGMLEKGQANFKDIVDVDINDLEKLHSAEIIRADYQFLDYVIANGLTNTLKRIIEKNSLNKDFSNRDLELIHAILNKNDAVIKEKIEPGAQFNPRMSRLLLNLPSLADTIHAKEILKMLDVNVQNNEGVTPLHMAAALGFTEEVALFIAKVNPNTPCKSGDTALHLAARVRQNGNEITKILLEAGGDSQIKNNKNESPLITAVTYNNSEVVTTYINHDTQIESKNDYARALFCAVHTMDHQDRTKIIRELIESGTNLNFKDESLEGMVYNSSILKSIKKSPSYSSNLLDWLKHYGENGKTQKDRIDRFTKKLLELKTAQVTCRSDVQSFIQDTCDKLAVERVKQIGGNFKLGVTALYKTLIEKSPEEIVQMFKAEAAEVSASANLPRNDSVSIIPRELQDFLNNSPVKIWDKMSLIGQEFALDKLNKEVQQLIEGDSQLSKIFGSKPPEEINQMLDILKVASVFTLSGQSSDHGNLQAIIDLIRPERANARRFAEAVRSINRTNDHNLLQPQGLSDNLPNELANKISLIQEKCTRIQNIKHNQQFGENIDEAITAFSNLSHSSNNKALQEVAKEIRAVLSTAEAERVIGQGLIKQEVNKQTIRNTPLIKKVVESKNMAR